MAYFSGFPFITYKFGGLSTVTSFQDLSAYVEVVDTIKDNVNFYNPITIGDNERPDTLAYRLYGNSGLYWTFFLMNDSLRERGWPLNNQDLDKLIKTQLPYQVMITLDLDTVLSIPAGTVITGVVSGATATILGKREDFGQLIIQLTSATFTPGEIVSYEVNEVVSTFIAQAVINQYDSIHHWEDDNGIYHDVDPTVGTSGLYAAVSFYEQQQRDNDNLKTINVIKPQAINSVQKAFKEALTR